MMEEIETKPIKSQTKAKKIVDMNMPINQYLMFMHLSQFLNFIIPFGGIACPLVMWLTKKDIDPLIDRHGKNITNWIISSFIYSLASLVLIFLIIGIFSLIAVGICSVIFTIIGAIKANDGVEYKYPLTITFIK
tara:strand:+ start:227 stop:628 length:402 start_codon:yes stop_codon:yes gene_type:complete